MGYLKNRAQANGLCGRFRATGCGTGYL